MITADSCLAIDLGASSGRAILGQIDNSRLHLNEIHRFDNRPVLLPDGLHWNVLSIYQEILSSITKAKNISKNVNSLGIDAWGLDFALLDARGSLIEIPFHYRDHRTQGMMAKAFQRISRQEIFQATGIQFMEINSLYQLFSLVVGGSPSLKYAERLLTIPDLFNYWLTGVQVCEYTEAITTQCYDSRQSEWSWKVIEALDIPKNIFPSVVKPGIILGQVKPELVNHMGIEPIKVIITASHDTASAVAAIPVQDENFAYISSGTWSLIGMEVDTPIINEESLAMNFTNEAGAENRFLHMKNITGLWLLQECQRHWEKIGNEMDFLALIKMAEQARPFIAHIHPNDPLFISPGDVPDRISKRCLETGQESPHTQGEFVRCILESLAMAYKHIIAQLENSTGRLINVIHIIGGGSQNDLLNQMTADATGKVVIAGPVEATALGNIIVQFIACGFIGDLAEARRLIINSFKLRRYEPRDTNVWDEVYDQWRELWNTIE